MSASTTLELPMWVVLHIPHASTRLPAEYRGQFIPDDRELGQELLLMTDHFTDEIFSPLVKPGRAVRFDVSRLLVDPERFEDDTQEVMAARGMGVIYSRTSRQDALRLAISPKEREELLGRFYRPHHQALEHVVEQSLVQHGESLVIDCHSFPSRALPYEPHPEQRRPEICIGTDRFHTPPSLARAFLDSFAAAGFDTAYNEPFAGALVSMKHFGRDQRVSGVMIEIRRDIYMNEQTGEKLSTFDRVALNIRQCCTLALSVCE